MELQHLNLTDLTPASLNVRKRGGKEIADLLPSIRANGLLQPLLVRPKGDGFEVVAGQRRYHALSALAKEQDTAEDVPCLVMAEGDDAKAIEASLAENVARLPMDDIDQYKAFGKLLEQGQNAADIAHHFGVTERLVKQRLAIANLIGPILTAYRADKIRPETLRILTIATKKQQRAWMKLFNAEDAYAPEGSRLKIWLFGGVELPTDNALFDLEDYKGAIISDLFEEESYFGDSAAFWDLQRTAIGRAKDDYLRKGWTAVVFLKIGTRFAPWEYVEMGKEKGGKIYVEVAQNGEVTFHEGYLSQSDLKKRQSKKDKLQKLPRPECTQPMMNYLGLHKHAAVRQTALPESGLIIRLAVAQMIAGTELCRCTNEPQKAAKHSITESLHQNPADVAFKKEQRAVLEIWRNQLSNETAERGIVLRPSVSDLYTALKTLSDDDVMRIFACVVLEILPAHNQIVDVLAQDLNVDMAAVWSPDQTFFDLLRDKSALNAMVAEVAGDDVAAAHITSTAKEQKAVIQACLDGTRKAKVKDWSPRYMQFPMQSYKPEDVEETETPIAAD